MLFIGGHPEIGLEQEAYHQNGGKDENLADGHGSISRPDRFGRNDWCHVHIGLDIYSISSIVDSGTCVKFFGNMNISAIRKFLAVPGGDTI